MRSGAGVQNETLHRIPRLFVKHGYIGVGTKDSFYPLKYVPFLLTRKVPV